MSTTSSPRLLPALALALAACSREPHPWETSDAGAPHVLPSPASSGSPSSAVASSSSSAEPGPAVEAPPTPPVRVGGPWVTCYGGFKSMGNALVDVTRLALTCGPANGMRRLSTKTLEGDVREGGPPITETFASKRGECYRVFAVGGPGVVDLDVVVRSSRGAAIAADHGDDAWPIVQPDRPFCPLEDDTLTVEVSARKGAGHFASEVWVLRSAPREAPKGLRTEE